MELLRGLQARETTASSKNFLVNWLNKNSWLNFTGVPCVLFRLDYKGNIEFFVNTQVEGDSQREQTIAIANIGKDFFPPS